ncbi:MAG: FliI/YscN family ATPase [Pseudomonadota bacterium]
MPIDLTVLSQRIANIQKFRPLGRVARIEAGMIDIAGLDFVARIGDPLILRRADAEDLRGEVLQISDGLVRMLPERDPVSVALNDRVVLERGEGFAPCDAWIGRVIDPLGQPIDNKPLPKGLEARDVIADPPAPATRQPLGDRLSTGLSVLNTLLPVVEGQRIGLFAGSGVGKSSLLSHLAQHMASDVVVVALIGERGRELNHFVTEVLGSEGMKRAVVVAATSDQSPLMRRRCAWSAMAVAEHFRDAGKSVLFLADSVTRFAEAHREIATAAGEAPALRGYPPSTAQMMMSLCERAGPGSQGQGAITGVFSVLVAGSDMEEPVADVLRGTLDGHIVLSRQIAERGRYPAIDVSRSVSRSLPAAASDSENALISETRKLLGAYERSEMMIRSGLYAPGSDPVLDHAVRAWPDLDAFIGEPETQDIARSFDRLNLILRRTMRG